VRLIIVGYDPVQVKELNLSIPFNILRGFSPNVDASE